MGAVFPLVDRFTFERMGVEPAGLRPGQVHVVESPRRLRCEQSYGFVHALWWVWLADGRSACSVPPGAGGAVADLLRRADGPEALLDADLAGRLREAVDAALLRASLRATDRVLCDRAFACNAALLRLHRHGDCRRLMDEGILPAEGLRLPTHCFSNGIAYGVVCDGRVVSVAYAHRTGTMEGRVADLGVETAPGYRRRGRAQTVVSAVVEHITGSGGEARYGCNPANLASVATAESVGFVPYGASLVLSAPVADEDGAPAGNSGQPLLECGSPVPPSRGERHHRMAAGGPVRAGGDAKAAPGRRTPKRRQPPHGQEQAP